MISLEYLAGFIDGEGSLSLSLRKDKKHPTPDYHVRISISNTCKDILEEIRKDFGGAVFEYPQRNIKWKRPCVLIWTHVAAEKLLARVAPFLRIKPKHAGVLLEFVRHKRATFRFRDKRGRLLPRSANDLRARHRFYLVLKHLNARGRTRLSSGKLSRSARAPARTARVSVEYLAGFIDAEGALFVARTHSKRYRSTWYIARITVASTDRPIIEEIKRDFGGTRVDIGSRFPGWRDAYTLVWTHAAAERLLMVVVPYLRVKAKQASILMEFMRHKRNTVPSRNGGDFARFPKSVQEIREAYYQQLKRLNARGPGLPVHESHRKGHARDR